MILALSGLLQRVSAIVMATCLLALVAIDFAQVVMRYGFGTGWPWAGDVAIILLLTLAWSGAGHLWLKRGHIAVDLIAPHSRTGRVLWLLFDVFVLIGGLVLVPMAFETMAAYAFIDLQVLPVSGAVKYMPVVGGLMFVSVAALLMLLLRRQGPLG